MSTDSGSIYVNYGGVNDVVDVLTVSTNAVQQIIDHITLAYQKMHASWIGSSNDAYAQLQQTWNGKMGDMYSLINKYGPVLDEMAGNYATTDNSLALQWSSIV